MKADDLFDIAWQATQIGADILTSSHPITVTKKGDRDLVTDVDLRIQSEVTSSLTRAAPHIAVLSEELSDQPDVTAAEYLWVLDPIDGTSNFVHGLPLCTVSLALLQHAQPVIAITRAPMLARTYHAVAGGGAFRNGEPITASSTTDLADAVVSLGDYAVGPGAADRNQRRLSLTAALVPRVHRIRMFGAATLDFAFVAEGVTDACIIMGNKPWDTAAGTLIAQEAGALVTDAVGRLHTYQSESTAASAPDITRQLTAVIEQTST
jgi:myo-inositol-1(or 4)-monophosphatase